MSLNQSKVERSDSHLRKSGRSGSSGNQRTFSGSAGGKGGGGTAPPPQSSSFNSSSSSNRSFKKSNNGQGGQSKVNAASTNSDFNAASARLGQNGAHVQPPLHGTSDAPATGVLSKPTNSQAPRSTRAVPRAPTSQLAAGASDSVTPTTPSKSDASRGFSLQFGSISPGFVNGMQIPARTSSAPPNLDEQKRDQASHDFRAVPTAPIPSAPKMQQPRKDGGNTIQSSTGDSHVHSQGKRDALTQVPAPTGTTATQKPSVLPIPGMSGAMSFQPQVPIPFGGPNAPIQPKGVSATSQQMSMPLPVGNSGQMQQQVFVPAWQSHPLQQQGIMPQGQRMNFPAQIGHQLPPQLGNLGIAQQQAGGFGGSCKVIITDPKTGKELSLGKRTDTYSDSGPSGIRSHVMPPQSQAIPSFPQINYYPDIQHNSYNPNSIFFQTPITRPLTSTQMPPGSQSSRYSYQVGQVPQNMSFINPSAINPLSVSKSVPPMHSVAEPLSLEHSHDSQAVALSAPSSSSIPVTVKSAVGSLAEKVGSSSVVVATPAVSKGESPKLLRPAKETSTSHTQRDGEIVPEGSIQQSKSILEPSSSVPSSVTDNRSTASATVSLQRPLVNTLSTANAVSGEESTSVVTSVEGRKRETVKRSNSFKDHPKKPSRKDSQYSQSQLQEDASDSAGISRSSSLKISRDIIKQPPENLQAPLAAGSSTSALSVPSQGFKNSNSLINGNTVEGEANDTSTEASGASFECAEESVPSTAICANASELATDGIQNGDLLPSKQSGIELERTVSDNMDTVYQVKKDERALPEMQLKQEDMEAVEEGQAKPTEGDKQVSKTLEMSSGSTSGFSEGNTQKELDPNVKETSVNNEFGSTEAEIGKNERSIGCDIDIIEASDNLVVVPDSVGTMIIPSSSIHMHEHETSTMDTPTTRSESTVNQDVSSVESDVLHQEASPALAQVSSEVGARLEGKGKEATSDSLAPASMSSAKDKPTLEPTKMKSNTAKGKKKKKDILKAADAAGSTSDLYMAYKGPEVKLEPAVSSESIHSSASVDVKPATPDYAEKNAVTSEEDLQIKAEPDDWEDAADISTPKLKTSYNVKQGRGGLIPLDEDGSGIAIKKYSRDFLLTFVNQCTDLPMNFEIGADIADALMSVQVGNSHLVDREPYPNSGRNMDRSGGPRPERRGSGMINDDKWSKSQGPFGSGRDPRMEIGHGGGVSFRPGQGGNHGVLRNQRGQSGGILSGPVQSLASQGGIQRNNSDADTWQRATALHKGLIPAPQTHLQIHKAEKKYEIGKVSDKEESKQRQLKAILNKLTPQNFDKLFEQAKEVNIDNAVTLAGVISQIFDKALMEPTFCEMYANFCSHLAGVLPDLSEDNEKITFKRLLLNKCQEEFERGEREQAEANRVEEEGEIKCSEEERVEKKTKARRRMLGNIRLIGELYKKRMLTERIMHECIRKLLGLGHPQNADEEDVEALCKLMSTIGEMIDHPKAKEHMDAYFDMMAELSNDMNFSSRVRFMLKDAIDLRKNKWQQRRKVEGPKKIEEVHRDAAQERQAQASRLARGPSIGSAARRGQMDFGPRGSTMLSSPNAQMNGIRGLPAQIRGYGGQDVRMEDRHPYESRMLSVPLSQRPIDDDSITLGPQGGLARGMSIRGQPLMSGVPLVDMSPSPGESRRIVSGPNGYSSASEWTSNNSREEVMPRYPLDRSMAMPAYEQLNSQERHTYLGNRDCRNADRSFDRAMATSPATRIQGSSNSSLAQHAASEKVYPEERLRDMSISAIREYYSAKDEKEVALCVKDLNSPSFHPSMISLWVTDSFERKDMDRDLLAKLLVSLTNSRDSLLNPVQLIKGFEFVLDNLEDAVNDAPRAAEFLGRILAKIILENVIPLRDIEQLIHESGEERRLLQIGLASDILGSVLEIIKLEKGESVLNDIRKISNLRLEDFRPPDPIRSRKLDAFL